jgi:hypothetical protein
LAIHAIRRSAFGPGRSTADGSCDRAIGRLGPVRGLVGASSRATSRRAELRLQRPAMPLLPGVLPAATLSGPRSPQQHRGPSSVPNAKPAATVDFARECGRSSTQATAFTCHGPDDKNEQRRRAAGSDRKDDVHQGARARHRTEVSSRAHPDGSEVFLAHITATDRPTSACRRRKTGDALEARNRIAKIQR